MGANVSASTKASQDISSTFMSMLMESVTECKTTADQVIDYNIQAGGDIDIGGSMSFDQQSI